MLCPNKPPFTRSGLRAQNKLCGGHMITGPWKLMLTDKVNFKRERCGWGSKNQEMGKKINKKNIGARSINQQRIDGETTSQAGARRWSNLRLTSEALMAHLGRLVFNTKKKAQYLSDVGTMYWGISIFGF